MDSFAWTALGIGLICAAMTIGLIAFSLRGRKADTSAENRPYLSMLFQGETLIDADDRIWSLFLIPPTAPVWSDLRLALLPMIPDLPKALRPGEHSSDLSEMEITIATQGDRTHVTVYPSGQAGDDWFTTRQCKSLGGHLQSAMMLAPDPIWAVTDESDLLWGNEAFNRYAHAHGGGSAFRDLVASEVAKHDPQRPKRLDLKAPGLGSGENRWLEVTTQKTKGGQVYFAIGVDAVVRAEAAQQNFVQTLSKTFANLTTGLAIFDRDRRLVLFNPALVDLSRVPIDFLSSRPALFEFFDKLRDCRVMPEPKSYDDWRERMARLVAAACDDRFRETWSLANGQTFDVTGQPYPDGAIAFLFNDITAEVSLTRGFRTELDTLQSVIDTFDDAVAVFDSQGTLTVCNTAYADLWSVEPEACILETTIVEATQSWKSAFHPSPVWPELRDFVTSSQERVSWDSELRSKDGREVICRIDPICHGATLIRFCHHSKNRDAHPEPDGLKIVSA